MSTKRAASVNGRYHVSCEDVRALAYPVLRHRILVNFQAESEGVTSEEIVRRLLEAVPEPTSGLSV